MLQPIDAIADIQAFYRGPDRKLALVLRPRERGARPQTVDRWMKVTDILGLACIPTREITDLQTAVATWGSWVLGARDPIPQADCEARVRAQQGD